MHGSASCFCFRCRFRRQALPHCTVDHCEHGAHARGLCRAHYLRKWRERSSPDRRRRRGYSDPTLERRRSSSRERYRKNPERSRALTQAWRDRNGLRVKAVNRQYRQSKFGRFATYRHSAKRRGIEWALSFDQFLVLTGRLCNYCSGVSEGKPDVGIWRIDRTRGFEWDNCVPCCYSCSHSSEQTRQRRAAENRSEGEIALTAKLENSVQAG